MFNLNLHFLLFFNKISITNLLINYQKTQYFQSLQEEPFIIELINNSFWRKMITLPVRLARISYSFMQIIIFFPLFIYVLSYLMDGLGLDILYYYNNSIPYFLIASGSLVIAIIAQLISNHFFNKYIEKLKNHKIQSQYNYFEIFENEINEFRNFKVYKILDENKDNNYGLLILFILLLHIENEMKKPVESYFDKSLFKNL